ncbi:MAG: NADP-dependent phosphogluconate dehydrogenase [Desulfovibrionaceae bacterium]
MKKNDIGLVGLAVMGSNLALNMARNGFSVAVYNRTNAVTRAFAEGPGKDSGCVPYETLEAFVDSLALPRRIVLMVRAGVAVDTVIAQLTPLLDPDDLIMDCGNSHYPDSERRGRELTDKGFRFMGVGVSGGEEGALWGPSIMPGGPRDAYPLVEPVFTAIAARAGGEPCVAHMGAGGAGHFVKMVHNGIEYGDMQLIAEAYALLGQGAGLDAASLHTVFADWNKGVLSSYLVEITADIFTMMDPESGAPLVDRILDKAGQKGTGRWTVRAGLDLGVPVPTITAAVEARALSAAKQERVRAAGIIPGPTSAPPADPTPCIDAVGDALYAAKICSYAQGFALMRAADAAHGFGLRYGEIARIWRGGCIIRARFLDDVRTAFEDDPTLPNLLLAPFFRDALAVRQQALRTVVATATQWGIPVPAMAASLAYFDGYRSARLPANLLQAQRDYFGAHTYERTDREGVFHTQWTPAKA